MRAGLITLATALFLLGSAAPASGGVRAAPVPGNLFLWDSPCALNSPSLACWVMPTNTTYALYWVPPGFSVDRNYEALIDRYLSDVAAASGSATNVYSVAAQYYDDAAAVRYQSSFAGSFVDTHPFPASGCNDGSRTDRVCLTDKQIQRELGKVVAARHWRVSRSTIFFVMTPRNVGSCRDSLTDQCTTTQYCAYHSFFSDARHGLLVYANLPYEAAIRGCWDGTSPNRDDADATINMISHEQMEAITDPAGNAWLDSSGKEIGDLCARQFGTPLGGTVGVDAYNQLINGHEYWLQEEYSNDGGACLQRYTPTVAPSTVARPVLHGVAAEGRLLTASEGSWQHAPTGFTYQWQRCTAARTGCSDISGATAANYELTPADLGHTIRAEVTAQNAAGTSTFAASRATATVAAAAKRPVEGLRAA